MKKYSLLPALPLILILVSCKKETNSIKEDPLAHLMTLTDSCSYTIDGHVFTANEPASRGIRNAGANLDTSGGAWKWDADSLHFSKRYKLINYSGFVESSMEISFAKTYHKNQLVPMGGSAMLLPASDLDLYSVGHHPYAIDFGRFNSQDGIVLTVLYKAATINEYLSTVTDQLVSLPTSIGPDSQDNSSFKVISFTHLPDNTYLLIAKFSANVFNVQEQPKRLENGYIRLRVSQ